MELSFWVSDVYFLTYLIELRWQMLGILFKKRKSMNQVLIVRFIIIIIYSFIYSVNKYAKIESKVLSDKRMIFY